MQRVPASIVQLARRFPAAALLFSAAFLILAGCNSTDGEAGVPFDELATSDEWTLLWADEFDDTTLDENSWSFQEESAGRFNNEWQQYVSDTDNAAVSDGSLALSAFHTGGDYGPGAFTSARLITYGKVEFTFGRVAARIRVPYGQGIWPAFWMLGSNISENPGGMVDWPKCGEIDIMEKIGGGKDDENERTLHGTIHYWADNDNVYRYQGGHLETGAPLADDFHVYEIEWNSEEIIWRLDNREYHRQDISGPEFDEFRFDFYILLNLAVGGNWPGYPDEATPFPQTMTVDWVRVYQRAVSS